MTGTRHAALAWLTLAAALTACGAGPARPPAALAAAPATTGAIVGTVRDRATGEPLSFATVMAVEPNSDSPPRHTDTSGAAGDFAIDGLAPGTYRVTVFYSNVSARWQDVQLAAGQRFELTIDLALDPASPDAAPAAAAGDAPARSPHGSRSSRGVITGRVTDQVTGEQLEGAVVAAMTPALRDAQMAVSDERGEFRLVGLPPGIYKLSCYYRLVDYGDIEVLRTNIEVVSGQTTDVPIRLDTSATSPPD